MRSWTQLIAKKARRLSRRWIGSFIAPEDAPTLLGQPAPDEGHSICDPAGFVDEAEIDSRYWEKPYYRVPDGDDADEGHRNPRWRWSRRARSIGQVIMHGASSGIKAHGKGLMLSILRYGNEVHAPQPYFQRLTSKPNTESVILASELIKRMSARFEPRKCPTNMRRAILNFRSPANLTPRMPSAERAPSRAP